MYQRQDVSFADVPQLSVRDKAYQTADVRLRPFYKYDVSHDDLKKAAQERRQYPVDRQLLVAELLKQYEAVANATEVKENINALSSEDTFTIITAHQPSLLTGPLYFIYKICSTISLTEEINKRNSDFKTVPLFILGGEDHDFDEIATAHLFGQHFTWVTDQVGSTGRMQLDGLDDVLSEIKARLGDNETAIELKSMIEQAYEASNCYGDFMWHFVHALFGRYGLIVANMDNAAFKAKLLPYVIKDLNQEDSKRCVIQDQEALDKAGFKSQAHAREVNVFWMSDDRHRVIKVGEDTYRIGESICSKADLIDLFKNDPGSISPNVILRPIYQELIMPNLAYVGGGGELAYWLERKSLFDHWELSFPMLIRRDSIKIIDKRSNKWLTNAGLSITDLFDREEQVIGKYTHLQSAVEINLSAEKSEISATFDKVKSLAKKIDPTLEKTVSSEEAKALKALDHLESKLLRAEKNKNEVGINKLAKMKQKFFPGNDGLQERYDNFIPYYLRYGQDWLDAIIDQADPLDKSFKLLIEG